MKTESSSQIFEKLSNTKLHENPSNGNKVVPCGRTDATNLMVTFRNFSNAPTNIGSNKPSAKHLQLAQSLYVVNIFAKGVVAKSYTLARRIPTPCYPHSLNTFQHLTLPCGTLLRACTRKDDTAGITCRDIEDYQIKRQCIMSDIG